MIEAKNQDSRNKSGFQCINFFLFYDIANSFFLTFCGKTWRAYLISE